MVEARGLAVGPGGEIAVPINFVKPEEPASEKAETTQPAESLGPVEKATAWYASERGRLQGEIDDCYQRLETDRTNQVELLSRIGELAAEKRLLSRADCPELSQTEQQMVEAQDTVESLLEQYSTVREFVIKYQVDETEAAHWQRELDRLGRDINYQLEQLQILGHDVRREKG